MNLQTTVDIKKPLLWLAWCSALLGGLPLWPHLQRPVQLLLPLALFAGIWAERRGRVLLGGYWGTLAVVLVFLFYALQIRITYLVDPMINMLALMLAVRVAGEKNPRNLLQLYMLAIFTLAASTLISLEMSFIVYLLLVVFVVTVSLVLLAFYTHDQHLVLKKGQLRSILSWSLLLPVVSLLLMVLFFFVLPRTRSPLMHFLNPGGEASAGLSESVAPGSVAGNAGNPAVAFRAEGPELDPAELYWRAIVLNTLEGSVWRRRAVPAESPGRVTQGQQVELKVLPEGWRQNFLVTLDKPLSVDRHRVEVGDDLVYSFRRTPRHRFEYRLVVQLSDRLPSRGPADMSSYLQVPEPLDPRVVRLAQQIRSAGSGGVARIAELQRFFSGQELSYSTRDLPVTDNPVGNFLFESRTGYCEHFASSFAMVLRLAGVPSRLVGGYYGGVYNRLGGYTLVTESMAHVWVEAFVPGEGWLRIDPSQYAVNVESTLRDFSRHRIPNWRELMDSVEHFWAQAVLNFYLEQQLETVFSAQRNIRSLRHQFRWQELFLILGGVALLALSVWLWRRPRLTAQQRLIRRLRDKVARCYGEEWGRETLGLQEVARGTRDPAVAEFARLYQEAIYGDRPLDPERRVRLRQLLDKVGDFRR
ncbi:MAG: hypothetical protein C0624_06830 [Desulfuromonas sp.]|nr:MAG: hypothetical protein C0624_06830 [Desulfuromonas sp.]